LSGAIGGFGLKAALFLLVAGAISPCSDGAACVPRAEAALGQCERLERKPVFSVADVADVER